MIHLPETFPRGEYAPFGYIDNPWHTAVLNRSGVVRSVPPIGFGYWRRSMPWPYGMGTRRNVNYLSFLHPAFVIDDSHFLEDMDFRRENVRLVSGYHTKNAMTYDWSFRGVNVRLLYHLVGENTLRCVVDVVNTTDDPRAVTLHATHIYGYPEQMWWGSDGVASRFNAAAQAAVAKIWAYGDVFALKTDGEPAAYKATASEDEWRRWIVHNDLSSNDGASSESPEPVYSVLSVNLDLAPGEARSTTLTLTCGVNELWTTRAADEARAAAPSTLQALLDEDENVYRSAPILTGDWPENWRNGWVYDLETLRQCVRQPTGIFKHHWDAMQVFSPRSVLGEAVIDAMCLSYADPDLAKDVILGTFADAPMPNVPCVREDGSMNMVSMGGEECGTAPIWVLPFRTIRSVYDRDRDDAWVAELYPHMEAFVQWWLDNRTDATGRLFCNNSWESGQDGSKRFLIAEGEEGKEAEYVQTVDVEAAMADAMRALAYLAPAAGRPERAAHWSALADEREGFTRSMFVDGWFRDFDARTGDPIILPDYLDVMMLLPLSVGIATPEQAAAVRPKFQYFVENPKLWLEWPSFLFCYTEAGQTAGLGALMAEVVGATADRVYARTNGKAIVPIETRPGRMPDAYRFRIPGTSNEFWPMDPAALPECGSEAYGWGATLPTLILRNIIGFREDSNGFTLAPTLPAALMVPGRSYTVTSLRCRACRFDLTLEPLSETAVRVTVRLRDGSAPLTLHNAEGTPLPDASRFEIANGGRVQARIG
ncbi:MAG TPA: trehalase family glycosidase [Armatimonadota bacterium]|jgi:hypothetical protein